MNGSLVDNQTSLSLMQMSQGKLGMEKLAASNAIKSAKNDAKLERAAKEFESVFISEMMKPMFEGLETDGLFGGGQGEKIFRGIMLQEVGKVIASTDRVGIAPKIKDAMIRMQSEQTMRSQEGKV